MDDDLPEFSEPHILEGITGAVSAFTSITLERIASLNMAMDSYMAISTTIDDLNKLMDNSALGSYTRVLCLLMYKLGVQHANEPNGCTRCEDEGENANTTP